MKPGNGVLAVAAVLFVATALFALWNVDNRDGIACGGWMFPNDSWAKSADASQSSDNAMDAYRSSLLGGRYAGDPTSTEQVDACAAARGERTPFVIVLGVATLAALVVGVLRRYQPRGTSDGNTSGNQKPIPRIRRDED